MRFVEVIRARHWVPLITFCSKHTLGTVSLHAFIVAWLVLPRAA